MDFPELREAYFEAVEELYHERIRISTLEENLEILGKLFEGLGLPAGQPYNTFKDALEEAVAHASSGVSQRAHNVRHAAGRKRKAAIIKEWLTGNYETRPACAKENWKDLGFPDEIAARTALERTQDPNPWPAQGPRSRPKKAG